MTCKNPTNFNRVFKSKTILKLCPKQLSIPNTDSSTLATLSHCILQN